MTSPYMMFDGVVEEQYSTLDPVTRLIHNSHIRLLVRRELDDKVHPDLGVCRSAVRDRLNRPTGKITAPGELLSLKGSQNYNPGMQGGVVNRCGNVYATQCRTNRTKIGARCCR